MSAPDTSALPEYRRARSTGPPLVILNPAGNRGRCAKLRAPLEKALAGGRGELALTNAPGAAEQMAADAARGGRSIIAVGGDGTLSEVAGGILASGQRVPLGIVPAGSGNDYACQTLQLPRDPLKALEIALHGTPTPMDAGAVNGRYFINSLGVGIDANIAARPSDSNMCHYCAARRSIRWLASMRCCSTTPLPTTECLTGWRGAG